VMKLTVAFQNSSDAPKKRDNVAGIWHTQGGQQFRHQVQLIKTQDLVNTVYIYNMGIYNVLQHFGLLCGFPGQGTLSFYNISWPDNDY
jgi:hypothetical protein